MILDYDLDITAELDEAVEEILSEIEDFAGNLRGSRRGTITRTEPIDLDSLLYENRKVAVVWCIDDVLEYRPDLTFDQAWEVLKHSHDKLASSRCSMHAIIDAAADELFPRKRKRRPAKAAEIIAGYGDGCERENLVDLLADTLHWCEGFGEPFDSFLSTAEGHFADETAQPQNKGE